MRARSAGWLLLCALCWPPARAAEPVATGTTAASTQAAAPLPKAPATVRSGREIYQRFHDGLADPRCDDAGNPRWRDHFAAAPKRLSGADDQTLALFGYVVDAVRAASLPTEYALIPFVESGYRPGARSRGGPAGLWQMITVTARDHDVTLRPGYDGRLSPVESTAAAVRYLKTLHGMFAGDWRLAVMAYNTGEYRVLDALHRSGQQAAHADPAKLRGLPQITRDYVRKLHALSCLLDQADDGPDWMQALDHPVPLLQARAVPAGARTLENWAKRNGRDPALLRQLNPAFAGGRIPASAESLPALVPATPFALVAKVEQSAAPGVAERSALSPVTTAQTHAPGVAMLADAAPPADSDPDSTRSPARATSDVAGPKPAPATHTVARGESAWSIARRYGLRVEDLLARNHLLPRSVLRPGTVLQIALASD